MILADARAAAGHIEELWREVPPDAWSRPTAARSGTRPAWMSVWARWRETEIHHVDLDAGYTHRDWPAEDHLDFASREDLARMAEASTVAVLVPGVNYHLLELTPGRNGEPPAKASFPGLVATMFDVGLRVALSTDYNPGTSPTLSMQTVLQLAARLYRLDYGQIWQMATINAAAALGRAHDRGSVETGKLADLVIWRVPEHGMVINRFGTNLADLVIKSGVVVTASRSPAGT